MLWQKIFSNWKISKWRVFLLRVWNENIIKSCCTLKLWGTSELRLQNYQHFWKYFSYFTLLAWNIKEIFQKMSLLKVVFHKMILYSRQKLKIYKNIQQIMVFLFFFLIKKTLFEYRFTKKIQEFLYQQNTGRKSILCNPLQNSFSDSSPEHDYSIMEKR